LGERKPVEAIRARHLDVEQHRVGPGVDAAPVRAPEPSAASAQTSCPSSSTSRPETGARQRLVVGDQDA
jgi:hypothetical protein